MVCCAVYVLCIVYCVLYTVWCVIYDKVRRAVCTMYGTICVMYDKIRRAGLLCIVYGAGQLGAGSRPCGPTGS